MRSTLSGSSHTVADGAQTCGQGASWRQRAVTRSSRTATSNGRRQRDRAPAKPFQVDQVGQHAVQPAGACGQAAQQLSGCVLGEATIGALERERGSEDRGQRGAKLVGDGRQEGAVQLVQGGQAPVRLELGHVRSVVLSHMPCQQRGSPASS
jgi:hypothetical protein